MRRITEMQNFDQEMLKVLQTTPEPSKRYKKAEPPLTQKKARKSPTISIERLATPLSDRRTPNEQSTSLLKLMGGGRGATAQREHSSTNVNYY